MCVHPCYVRVCFLGDVPRVDGILAHGRIHDARRYCVAVEELAYSDCLVVLAQQSPASKQCMSVCLLLRSYDVVTHLKHNVLPILDFPNATCIAHVSNWRAGMVSTSHRALCVLAWCQCAPNA